MDFWDRVNESVKSQRTTQEWVAGRAGISHNTFRGWISKKVLPRADQAQAIAKALGVTVEYLVTGADNTDPWLTDHRQLVADLKALTPESLKHWEKGIHLEAEVEREEARSSAGKDSAIG